MSKAISSSALFASFPENETALKNPLSFSSFRFLPIEMILKIFEGLPKTELHNTAEVCSLFKKIANDRTLFKIDLLAMVKTIKEVAKENGRSQEAFEEASLILQSVSEGHLTFFRLLSKFKMELELLPKEAFAVFFPDRNFLRDAPLFKNYFEKCYCICCQKKIEEELLVRGGSMRFNLDFAEENFNLFLETFQTMEKKPIIELDFTVSIEFSSRISQAFAENKIAAKEVLLIGKPAVNIKMLKTYLLGIAKSQTVKSLKFLNCSLYHQEILAIELALSENRSLSSLSFNDFAFCEESMDALIYLLESHPHIKRLSLDGCSEGELYALLERINKTSVEELFFSATKLTAGLLDLFIYQISLLKKVKILNLEQLRLPNEMIDKIEAAKELQKDKTLIILPSKRVDLSFFRRI